MNTVNEQLERLIVRSLDGELTDDEQLVLDRELIRNPDARRLLDEYRAVDGASITAMRAWIEASSSPVVVCAGDSAELNGVPDEFATAHRIQFPGRDSEGTIRSPHPTPRLYRWAIFVPGAIAAALLAIIIPKPAIGPPDATIRGVIPSMPPPKISPWEQPHASPGAMRNASWAMPATHRDTGRELIGIVGDDGNLYWIEVQRTRTIERGPDPLATAARLNEM